MTHRDLKTSNILLSRDGHTAKIGDVGLSRSMLTDLQSSNGAVGASLPPLPTPPGGASAGRGPPRGRRKCAWSFHHASRAL